MMIMDDIEECNRIRDYIFRSAQNPYSVNKEYIVEWMAKLRVLEERIRRTKAEQTAASA
jgi:hypothetical protein